MRAATCAPLNGLRFCHMPLSQASCYFRMPACAPLHLCLHVAPKECKRERCFCNVLHPPRARGFNTSRRICRLHATPVMGTPTCLGSVSLHGHKPESVMYGDSAGVVYMILADTSASFVNRDMLYTEHTHDYVCLHDKHSDWVSKVQHVEDVGLVTAALDSKIVIFDIQRCGFSRFHSCA